MRRALRELRQADVAAEESARFELTQSTRHFSRKAKKVMDQTMALSATLIRAGEVEEAGLLIAEAEREVRDQEVALVSAMNERQAERKLRREKITRLRLARLLAVAVVGASLMAVSVAGIAVASIFSGGGDRERSSEDAGMPEQDRSAPVERVRVAGVALKLTPRQLHTYNKLKRGRLGEKELRRFLIEVLPQVPVGLVAQVHDALVSATAPAPAPAIASAPVSAAEASAKVSEVKSVVVRIIKDPRRITKIRPKAPPTKSDAKPEPEPAPSPSDEEEEAPSSGGSSGDQEGEEEDGLLPLLEGTGLGG